MERKIKSVCNGSTNKIVYRATKKRTFKTITGDEQKMNTEEIKLLQAQNEALKKQCNSLQQEVKQWKHEYEMFDACIELEKGKIAELKAENERLKTQYNCYACGNCKGKEDYKNLEKHHIGLRKQFDKKVQTLQEIKAIAEYSIMHNEKLNSNYQIILQLITKAEEE